MYRVLYSLVYRLFFPFILLRLLYRARKAPAYAHRWYERLGLFKVPSLRSPIWIHAVSVGETVAAAPMIKALKIKYPMRDIVVTTMTPTGSERVKSLFGDEVFHVYAPYDMSGPITRFLNRVHPDLLIIMETELWPNMIHYSHRRGIRVMLANGRLSEKSAKGYQKISYLALPMLQEMDTLAVQFQNDGDHFKSLGLPKSKVQVIGSIKFDFDVEESDLEKAKKLKGRMGDRLIWIAASTHAGEDEIILEAHRQLRSFISNALLILVPRHPERFESVYSLMISKGFEGARFSRHEIPSANQQVLLGDTMGDMMCLMAASDMAFIGGSLVERGGHNPLEPAALGIPVLSGPYVFNFEAIYHQLSESKAVKFVGSADLLSARLIELCEDADYRQEMGQKALRVLNNNKGALDRLLTIIERQLGE
jgi:3-deoxy-D-manno-octulosonic-acid transferase